MTDFDPHSIESAPEASKASLEHSQKAYGFLPNLHAVMAEAPTLLEGYKTLAGIFEKGTFTPIEQQVVYLTSNYENECHYCMAAHSGIAKMVGAADDVVTALREGTPIADAKLEALRVFTRKIVVTRGWVDAADVTAFLAAGYTEAQVLEVILGTAVKVMSNYTNHLAQTPVDDRFAPLSWTHPDKRAAAE